MTRKPIMVPRLRARDICRRQLNGLCGTHCLSGWHEIVFPCPETGLLIDLASPRGKAWKALKDAAESRSSVGPVSFNDDGRNSLAEIADLWNRALAPLCKPIPKTRRGK